MKEKGFAHIGIGEAEGENRTVEAVRQAVNNRLLDTNIREASAAILFITGGMDLSLTEINEAGSLVAQVLNPDATLIFGADMSQELGGKVSVTIIATGFKHGSDPVLPRFVQQRPTAASSTINVPVRERITPAPDLPPMPDRRPPLEEPASQQQPDDFGGRIPLSDNDLPAFMRKLKRRP